MLATGLEKGGIYRHFANKQELAAEAFRFALAQSVKLRTGRLDEISGSIAKLRKVVEVFIDTPSAIPGGCPLMNTAIDADDGNEALRDLARKGIQDWRARLARIVEHGIRAKEIRSSIEPRRIANTLIATLEGALMISRLENSRRPLRDAQASLEVLFDSIAVVR
jgi:TetR/AcrR family transcriptional repressor of nem operon